MRTSKHLIKSVGLTLSVIVSINAQNNDGAVITLPWGISITTTNFIIGLVAVISVAVVATIIAIVRNGKEINASPIQIFQNNNDAVFQDIVANMNARKGGNNKSSKTISPDINNRATPAPPNSDRTQAQISSPSKTIDKAPEKGIVPPDRKSKLRKFLYRK